MGSFGAINDSSFQAPTVKLVSGLSDTAGNRLNGHYDPSKNTVSLDADLVEKLRLIEPYVIPAKCRYRLFGQAF